MYHLVIQATLGTGSSTKKSILQCNVGDKKPVYLCSLLPEKFENCPLNLEFEEEDEVIFSVIGAHSIHLSGFFLAGTPDCCRDDDESYPLDFFLNWFCMNQKGFFQLNLAVLMNKRQH